MRSAGSPTAAHGAWASCIRASRAASYAKRFAAKEACAKALGTGINAGVFWRDMGVVNLPSGKPTMHLTGGAAERLTALTPPGHIAVVHLTLTDEYPIAQAQVIIEAVVASLQWSPVEAAEVEI